MCSKYGSGYVITTRGSAGNCHRPAIVTTMRIACRPSRRGGTLRLQAESARNARPTFQSGEPPPCGGVSVVTTPHAQVLLEYYNVFMVSAVRGRTAGSILRKKRLLCKRRPKAAGGGRKSSSAK